MRILTIGHGTRPLEEFVGSLQKGRAETLIDIRSFPSSRRNPQFNQASLAASLGEAGIAYRHALELGGRRSGEPGQDRFDCIRTPAFRSYAARMGRSEWQQALADALAWPAPCFMCAETLWWQCHRRLVADLLHARGHEVVHLIRPGEAHRHRLADEADAVDGKLFLCGVLVA